jgi:hypothetical protein
MACLTYSDNFQNRGMLNASHSNRAATVTITGAEQIMSRIQKGRQLCIAKILSGCDDQVTQSSDLG